MTTKANLTLLRCFAELFRVPEYVFSFKHGDGQTPQFLNHVCSSSHSGAREVVSLLSSSAEK